MKSSGNATLSMLIFLALATTLFVYMVMRPAVERNSINLGVPLTDTAISSSTSEAPAAETEAPSTETPEESTTEADVAPEENTTSTETPESTTEESSTETTTTN